MLKALGAWLSKYWIMLLGIGIVGSVVVAFTTAIATGATAGALIGIGLEFAAETIFVVASLYVIYVEGESSDKPSIVKREGSKSPLENAVQAA